MNESYLILKKNYLFAQLYDIKDSYFILIIYTQLHGLKNLFISINNRMFA